jgi:hypothetical protein
MPGSGVHHVVIVDFGRPHGKAVVMLGGNDDIFHSGVPGKAHPGIGIEIRWIKITGDFPAINRARNFHDALDMLGITPDRFALPGAAGIGIDAPMNEHAKPRVTPPSEPVVQIRPRIAPPLGIGTVFGRQVKVVS